MAPSFTDMQAYKKDLKDCFSLGDPSVYPEEFISDIQAHLDDFPADLGPAARIKLVASKFVGEPRRRWLVLDSASRPASLDALWIWIRTCSCQDPCSQFHQDYHFVTTTMQTTSVAQLITDVRPAQQRLLTNPQAALHGVNEALIITWFINSLQHDLSVELRRQRARDPTAFASLSLVHQAAILEDSVHHAADYDHSSDSPDNYHDYVQDFQDPAHDPEDFDYDSQDPTHDSQDPTHDSQDFDYDSQDYHQDPHQALPDIDLAALTHQISHLVHQQLQQHPVFQAHRQSLSSRT
jgi:hypothetical protein